MILPILEYPDPRLKKVAAPVSAFTPDIAQAGPTTWPRPCTRRPGSASPRPRWTCTSASSSWTSRRPATSCACSSIPRSSRARARPSREEGCLSVPGYYDKVTRAARVRVRAQDAHGKPFELDADGLLAVCIQHEMDHLVGKVFVDYLSPLKRARLSLEAQEEAEAGRVNGIRAGFAGTPEFAATALEALVDAGVTIPLVLTQPDRPQGRGLATAASPVKRLAQHHGLALAQPATLRDADTQAAIAAARLDVLVVAAYGLILPQAGPRRAAPRLPQHPCVAAAALARRGAGRARDRSRRRRDRRHDHADGCGARHRGDDRDAARGDRCARHRGHADGEARGRGRAGDRRRAGAPGARRPAGGDAAARRGHHLCAQDRARRRTHRLDARRRRDRPRGSRIRSLARGVDHARRHGRQDPAGARAAGDGSDRHGAGHDRARARVGDRRRVRARRAAHRSPAARQRAADDGGGVRRRARDRAGRAARPDAAVAAAGGGDRRARARRRGAAGGDGRRRSRARGAAHARWCRSSPTARCATMGDSTR